MNIDDGSVGGEENVDGDFSEDIIDETINTENNDNI
jgi:hypothetical protein